MPKLRTVEDVDKAITKELECDDPDKEQIDRLLEIRFTIKKMAQKKELVHV